MPTVRIPTPLRPYAGGNKIFETGAISVKQAIEDLSTTYPELKWQLFIEDGGLRSSLHIFLKGKDVRSLQGMGTPLEASDELVIVAPITGG